VVLLFSSELERSFEGPLFLVEDRDAFWSSTAQGLLTLCSLVDFHSLVYSWVAVHKLTVLLHHVIGLNDKLLGGPRLARHWPIGDGAENKVAGGLLDASLNPSRRACVPVWDDQLLFDLKRSSIRDSAPNARQT
jgi:hypothetical protein